MSINLANYQNKAEEAVKNFWSVRELSRLKQIENGKIDQGERSGVTSGKNMDGFVDLLIDIVKLNGLQDANIFFQRKLLTLPGHFRPTKLWDLLVINNGHLVAAIELKSQVGPSFGNNFNNRAEEAIGTALDLWTAYREGAFGESPRPFVGWLMLLEDHKDSRTPVRRTNSPHFSIDKEFLNTSYADSYNILCKKLIQEQLYSTASLIVSPRTAINSGEYHEFSELTSLKNLIASFAGHIAAESVK